MRSSVTVARQLRAAASLAAIPVASTSRPVLKASLGRVIARRFPDGSRSLVTIPHPDLDASKGESHYVIQSHTPIPTTVHALLMLRAVEERLGPVLSIQVPKDADTLKPLHTIFLTLLRPTKLKEPLTLEIPSPVLSRPSTLAVGPSFAEIEAALRHAKDSRSLPEKGTIRFNVELRKTEPRPTRARTQRIEPTETERREDDAIVRALAAFDGGFNGGFDGVADKFKALEMEPIVPKEETVAEVVEEVIAPVAKPVKRAPQAPERVEVEESPTPAPEAAPRVSRAEKLRLQAIETAQLAAAHAAAAEKEEASAAAAAAAEAQASETKTNAAPESNKSGILGWLGQIRA